MLLRPRHDLTLPVWLAVPLGIAGGAVLTTSFPAHGWWPAAFVGVVLILLALRGRSLGMSLLIGFGSGMTFYLTLIHWTSLYLGPLPWLALSVLESAFFMLGALLITLAYRHLPRLWPSATGRLVLVPLAIAGAWTAREAVSNRWPYGGFAWGRLAQSQSLGPLASLAAWVGLAGMAFLIAWVAASVVELITLLTVALVVRLAVTIATAALIFSIPAWPTATDGTVRVGAVQGNGKAGYFDQREPGDVLRSQIAATEPLFGDDLDLLVWPEGSNDISPLANASVARALDTISRRVSAPVITNTVTKRGSRYYNTSLVWRDGKAEAHFDKRHPVPFGEYVPDRELWEPLAPDLLGLIQRDYTPGTSPAVLDVDGIRAGFAICFDIVDDGLIDDVTDHGADLILAQTNNADFGRTEENLQQLALARLRAIETGRSVVNISTVGASQIIGPTGQTLQEIPPYEPGHLLDDVPIGVSTTPASIVSRGIEIGTAGFGILSVVVALISREPRERS